jgi:hypothetical protein
MNDKREKFQKIMPEIEKFLETYITTIPFNLQTAEIILKAFSTELGIKDLINQDEYFGMMIATILIEKMAKIITGLSVP